MKTVFNRLLRVILGLVLLSTIASLPAQTFSTPHRFDGSDGTFPVALILSDQTLYGVATEGGFWNNNGTVFKVKSDGTDFSVLYSFKGGSDGSIPVACILSGNTLYGTTQMVAIQETARCSP